MHTGLWLTDHVAFRFLDPEGEQKTGFSPTSKSQAAQLQN